MSQGVGRNKEEVIEALRPYFQLGCSVLRACAYGGVPQSTVQTWINDDPDLRVRITSWQNEISAAARSNWRAKIEDNDYAASKDWLERNEKAEFSLRNEHTGAEGAPIAVEIHADLALASAIGDLEGIIKNRHADDGRDDPGVDAEGEGDS